MIRQPYTVRNKRRDSYDVERRSTILPVIFSATVAAVVMHMLIYWSIPYLIKWDIIRVMEQVVEKEEVIRIIATEREVEEHIEDETPFEDEITADEKAMEPEEIDLIDMEFEELVMAPGETNLTVAEPNAINPAPAMDSIPIAHIDMPLPVAPLAPIEEVEPEPAPINTNDIITKISSDKSLTDAQQSIEEQLLSDAGKTDGLPTDSRSLAELMRIENPGANSGVARLGADVLFSFGKAELLNASRITMIQLAALISKNPKTRFVIEGHTDSYGSDGINDILSLMRAASVRAWLEGNGIPIQNVYLRACGSHQPLVPTTGSKEDQKINRRVEIHMRKPMESLPDDCLPSSFSIDLSKSAATHLKEKTAAAAKAKSSSKQKN